MDYAIIYCQKCKEKTYHDYNRDLSLSCGIATFVCSQCSNNKKLHIIAKEDDDRQFKQKIKDFFR